MRLHSLRDEKRNGIVGRILDFVRTRWRVCQRTPDGADAGAAETPLGIRPQNLAGEPEDRPSGFAVINGALVAVSEDKTYLLSLFA